MPNIKSAKKRVAIAESRRLKNAAVKSEMKTQLKKFSATVVEGDKEAAQAQLNESISLLDKSASKGVIHKNMAARKKAAIYRAFNNMEVAEEAVAE
ncbi:MAG: 30S ribosomal protein S20 [Clostridia bacterium]|nr:30S ribosomal protein S20 [Clostridia bacterium]MDD4798402.1 30S ribosomal protein S20 [Clostridia bacterium]